MIEERDYQLAAKNAIFEYFRLNEFGNPVVAMPTGTGKSIVIAKFIQLALERYPTTRILKLTHVKELISQNSEKLLNVWPQVPMGIFSAGLKKKEAYHPIVFGGVQSVVKLLQKEPDALGWRDLVIIDECHLLSPKETSSYQKVLMYLRAINPRVRIIGFTATRWRLKSGYITDGEGLFDATCIDLCSTENFNRFLSEGYLAPLIPKRPETMIDTSRIGIVGGDYNSKELEESLTEEVMHRIVEETCLYGHDRKSWLVFAAGIDKAERLAELFQERGIDAATSHSKLSAAENDLRINAFKCGQLRALINNNKLTTGFDHPEIDLICMARPTQSPGLWVQMLGRGTRPVYAKGWLLDTSEGRLAAIQASEKRNCLVLDFAGNTSRLGPINDPAIPGKPRKGAPGEAPVKVCSSCGCYNHTSARFCTICDVEFTFEEKLRAEASKRELIKVAEGQEALLLPPMPFEEHAVTYVIYNKHQKNVPGSFPTLKVTYCTAGRAFTEWLGFSRPGKGRAIALEWWKRRSTTQPPPQSTEEALHYAKTLKEPTKILVNPNGEFPKIVDYYFEN